MTSPFIPERWARPSPPRRRGPVARWCAWWDVRRRLWQPGANIFNAIVLAWLLRGAVPSPETDGLFALVELIWLVWILPQLARWAWHHAESMARNARQQWYMLTPSRRDRGPRAPLASDGGPAGRPSGKVRLTKSRRRRRR